MAINYIVQEIPFGNSDTRNYFADFDSSQVESGATGLGATINGVAIGIVYVEASAIDGSATGDSNNMEGFAHGDVVNTLTVIEAGTSGGNEMVGFALATSTHSGRVIRTRFAQWLLPPRA